MTILAFKYVAPRPYPIKAEYRPYSLQKLPLHARKVMDDAGLPRELRLSDLRRTGTTEMVEAGVGMAQIMSVTGHANPASVKPYMKNTLKSANQCIDGEENTCYKHHKCRKGKCITCISIYNTNVYKYVSDLNIPNGTTRRLECPNCGERTFTVTNNMGSLLWNCFRVTCGVKGSERVHLSVDDIRAGFGRAEPPQWRHSLCPNT